MPIPLAMPDHSDGTMGTDHRGGGAERASDLWRLLDEGPEGSDHDGPGNEPVVDTATLAPSPASPAASSGGWVNDQLGELLAQAWQSADPAAGQNNPPIPTAEEWNGGATWEVDRLPTAAEGGVAAMFTPRTNQAPAAAPPPAVFPASFQPAVPVTPAVPPDVPEGLRGAATLDGLLSGRIGDGPDSPPTDGPSLDTFFAARTPPTGLLGSQPPAWGLPTGAGRPLPPESAVDGSAGAAGSTFSDPPLGNLSLPAFDPDGLPLLDPKAGGGRARLSEMLDHLPTEPTPRLRPEDVHIDMPAVAPVAIWFWGDDDIYPGCVPGAPANDSGSGRKRGRWTIGSSSDGAARAKTAKAPPASNPVGSAAGATAKPSLASAPPTAAAAALRRRLATKKH